MVWALSESLHHLRDDDQGGEANTLGGYLVFMIMIALSLFFNLSGNRIRLILGCSLAFAFPALMFTLSRGSWLAVVPAFFTLLVLSRKGRFIMFFAVIFVILSAAWLFPKEVKERFAYTFEEQVEFNFFGKRITLDESAAARVEAWTIGINSWKKSPLIGHGVGSPGPVVDNQYTRVLTEIGAVGMFFFLLIILRIFKGTYFVIREYRDQKFIYGLACGFFAGVVGILFHSLSAASFIIIRIIEPFWFMAAIILAIPEVMRLKQEEAEAHAEVSN